MILQGNILLPSYAFILVASISDFLIKVPVLVAQIIVGTCDANTSCTLIGYGVGSPYFLPRYHIFVDLVSLMVSCLLYLK